MRKDFEAVRKIISEYNNFIITTHLTPDGDAIGSQLSLGDYLKQKGKTVNLINYSPTPYFLEFLDTNKEIKFYRDDIEKYKEIIKRADVIFIVDTNEYSRTKSMEPVLRSSKALKVCIDHHLDLDVKQFDAVISNIKYPATSQILYEFFCDDSPDYINEFIAINLYTGIMSDTGNFRFPRTDVNSFVISADLVRRGANPVKIFDEVYNNVPKEKIVLLGRFIKSLTFYYNDKLVIGTVKLKDFEELNLNEQDVEGFSSFIMGMRTIVAGVVLVELKNSIKVSFRSKGNLNVNEIAKIFGGGGHKNASGTSIKDKTFDTLKEEIISVFKNYLK